MSEEFAVDGSRGIDSGAVSKELRGFSLQFLVREKPLIPFIEFRRGAAKGVVVSGNDTEAGGDKLESFGGGGLCVCDESKLFAYLL